MPERDRRGTRRGFLDWLLGTTLGAVAASILYPVFRFVIPPEVSEGVQQRVRVADLEALPPNSGAIVRFGAEPVIVLRTPGGDVRAFSAVCTHLSCTVQYRKDLQQIWCPCHDGHFDLQGTPVKGPPPRPLSRLQAAVEGGVVYVSRGGLA
jgi:Rieske Fe-S protein